MDRIEYLTGAPPAPAARLDTPVAVSSESSVERIAAAGQAFEAAFLAEMLKFAGLGETRDSFGGGQGEEMFSGFLVREYAEEIARSRPLGLGAQVTLALTARTPGADE